MSDQNTRTSLDLPPLAKDPGPKDPAEFMELEPDDAPEEKTIQGASFLVERITPIPPRGTEVRALAERERAALSAALLDAPTGAVQNPGLRRPPELRPPRPADERPEPRPERLEARPEPRPEVRPPRPADERPTQALPAFGGADMMDEPTGGLPPGAPPPWAALETQIAGRDASPDSDTAYVPLPVTPPHSALSGAPPPPGLPAPLAVPGIAAAPAATPLSRALAEARRLGERIRGSKPARLGILSGLSALGLLLTFIAFSPRRAPEVIPEPPAPVAPAQEARPAIAPPKEVDPARLEERDQLLERAILAVEAGRTDEALAIFRRYAEDQPDVTAEYMVQLLQMQAAQSGKER